MKSSLVAGLLAVGMRYALGDQITSSATQVFVTTFFGLYMANALYQIFIYPQYFSPLRKLPGPKVRRENCPERYPSLTPEKKDHHFLIGQSLNQFRASSPNEPFVSWVKRWPDADFIRFLSFGNTEALLVTSLAAHKEILQAKVYSFVKPPFFRRLIADTVGLGVIFAEGEDHKNQRKAFRGE